MKLHIITIGHPKLPYAKQGWEEYSTRLKRQHTVRVTHIADKYAYDSQTIRDVCGKAYKIALAIGAPQMTSPELAAFLDKRALEGREICFIVGGPEGLPDDVIAEADKKLGLSELTMPHDLAMVVLLEALYRAGTISAGLPYHK